MDTFNFSFFEDKPQTPETSAEETPPSPAPPALNTEPPTAPPADDDPFGFNEFDLSADEAPSSTVAPEPTIDFDLSSFDLNAPTESEEVNEDIPEVEISPSSSSGPNLYGEDEEEFPNLAFDTSFSSASSENETLSLAPIEPLSEPGLAPDAPLLESSSPIPLDEAVAEANESLAPESLDLPFLTLQPEPTTPSVPTGGEEIRASVTPAVFVTPAPAVPVEAPAPVAAPAAPVESPAPSPSRVPRTGEGKAQRFLTADDPFGEVAPPRERLRVAVLGASGIGKNHARWLAKHSCDVVSFLGSSHESVELTRSHLQAHMGFSGQGYSDLGQLLNQTQPQAVCIASPSPLHYAQAMQCLEAGIHVLCEKPLVYTPNRSKRENMDGARELLKAAAKRNLVLATQLQYGAATPILCRLAGVSPSEVGDFAMEIETTNAKSPREPKELWVDLAPHCLSVAQYLAGEGAELVEETVQLFPSRSAYTSEVSARFGVRCEGGRLLMCRAIVRWFDKIVDNRDPRRRFSFNGRVVQYSGVKSPDGTYIAQYVAPDGYISHYADPVDYLVGNFVRTCWGDDQLLLSAEQGVQNLNWLLTTAAKL